MGNPGEAVSEKTHDWKNTINISNILIYLQMSFFQTATENLR